MDSRTIPRYRVPTRPSQVGQAPFPMCLTSEAMETLLATVGNQQPESGAKGFGPPEKIGIDVVEFDTLGSRSASYGMYSPDTRWGDERCNYWLNRPDDDMRLWTADCHSHPGSSGYPSSKSGKAMGDLGYVEEVFAANESMQYFLMPILTIDGKSDQVTIWPWVISRDNPGSPLWADLCICSVADFPDRIFNPLWEAAIRDTDASMPSEILAGVPDAAIMPDDLEETGTTNSPASQPQSDDIKYDLLVGVAVIAFVALAIALALKGRGDEQ